MIKPTKEDFSKLVREYNIIPVYRTIPADLETPVSVYLKVTGAAPGSFLLESGDLGEKARYSFIGFSPLLEVYNQEGRTIVTRENDFKEEKEGDPLKVLEDIFQSFRVYLTKDIPAFQGGAVGYLSYDMVKYWEKIPPGKGREYYPRCCFSFPGKVLVYDHRRHLLTIVSLIYTGNNQEKSVDNSDKVYDKAVTELKLLIQKLKKENPPLPGVDKHAQNIADAIKSSAGISPDKHEDKGDFSKEEFATAVRKAIEYIKAGDIFQVVLSRRVTRDLKVHPFNLYRALRSLNPSPYQFYLSFEGFQVLGASPEMLVSLKDGYVSTRPIAGTRPRGSDDAADISLADELSSDEKERSEHMMLVDLGRNDLGKVSQYGSVVVDKLLEIEYFSHVIHLVSEVTGKIRPECRFSHLLRAAFPAGTVSGAPKVRAMEIIAETEPVARGPYAGAVGYINFNGDMDTCIAIRTIITGNGKAQIQAGAGIVADSDPYREFTETEHKMAASLKAIKLAEEWEIDDFNC